MKITSAFGTQKKNTLENNYKKINLAVTHRYTDICNIPCKDNPSLKKNNDGCDET